MKLSNREKFLIFFALFLGLFLGFVYFLLLPNYDEYKSNLEINDTLKFELKELNLKNESSNDKVLFNYTEKLDVFIPFLEDEEIDKNLMLLCSTTDFKLSEFHCNLDTDVAILQNEVKEGNRFIKKDILLKLQGNFSDLSKLLKEIEKSSNIELKNIEYISNFDSNLEDLQVTLMYFMRARDTYDIETIK